MPFQKMLYKIYSILNIHYQFHLIIIVIILIPAPSNFFKLNLKYISQIEQLITFITSPLSQNAEIVSTLALLHNSCLIFSVLKIKYVQLPILLRKSLHSFLYHKRFHIFLLVSYSYVLASYTSPHHFPLAHCVQPLWPQCFLICHIS